MHFLYYRDKFGGDHVLHASCRWKSVMFLFFLFVMLQIMEFVKMEMQVCENGNAIKQVIFRTILVPLYRGKVATIFKLFYVPSGFVP